MKKLLSITTLVLGLICFSNTTALAQSDMQLGVGLSYGDQVENLGIRADGYYTINEQFRAGVDLVYYFPDKTDTGFGELTTNYFAVNINGHYIFVNENDLMVYALAGINYLSVKAELGGNSDTNSETGLNLGAGVEYGLDFANLFGELKFAGIGGDADQLVLGAGLRFDL